MRHIAQSRKHGEQPAEHSGLSRATRFIKRSVPRMFLRAFSNKSMPSFVVGAIVVATAAPAYGLDLSEPFVCAAVRKEACTFNAPCSAMKANDTLIEMDTRRNKYSRCDPKGCDTYQMVRSGDSAGYVTFELPGRGSFSKIGPEGDWVEAVSLGAMVIVSHGYCENVSALKK